MAQNLSKEPTKAKALHTVGIQELLWRPVGYMGNQGGTHELRLRRLTQIQWCSYGPHVWALSVFKGLGTPALNVL